jgi:hypothetical protein
LQDNMSLRKLEYEKNEIGELGWEAFIETLRGFNVTLRFVRFAAEDPFYDKYYPQLVYFCDENGFGRHIVEKKYIVPSIANEVDAGSIPAGEPTAQSGGLTSLSIDLEFPEDLFDWTHSPTPGEDLKNANEGVEETVEWA